MHSLIHLHLAEAHSVPGSRDARAAHGRGHGLGPPPERAHAPHPVRGAVAGGLAGIARRLDRESAQRAVA